MDAYAPIMRCVRNTPAVAMGRVEAPEKASAIQRAMNDLVEKLLIALVGFVAGVGTNLIVDFWRTHERRKGLRKVMAAEVRAFAKACNDAERSGSGTATDALRLAELIQERYSKDPERWTTCGSKAAEDAITQFYPGSLGWSAGPRTLEKTTRF